MRTLKLALVGCGRVAKRHIEAVQSIKGIEITMLCDNNEQKVKQLSEQLSIPYVTDFTKIQNVDVVSVLTPSGLHPQHVIAIAEQTDTHYIVCEKPIALTFREALEMMNRVEKVGKTLLPVYQNRYNPLVEFLKQLIDSGQLGKIHQFICNVLWNRNDEYFAIDWHGTKVYDGGVLYTQASHYVDMIYYLLGKVKNVHGFGGEIRKLEVHDSVSLVCDMECGAVGTLNATVSVYRTNYLTEFTLIGQKGTIRLSGTNLNCIDFWDVENMEKPNMDFTIDHQYGKGHNIMYQYIVDRKWDKFPNKQDVLSGIALMERISF